MEAALIVNLLGSAAIAGAAVIVVAIRLWRRSKTRPLTGRSATPVASAPLLPQFVQPDDADPALLTAIEEARRTLPHCLDAMSAGRFPNGNLLVKVPFIDRARIGESALVRTSETGAEYSGWPICHLWLRVTSITGDLIFCAIVEAPPVKGLNAGATFVVAPESIEDWTLNHQGETYGAYSLRVIRKMMNPREREQFDHHTGIESFKEIAP